MKDLNLEELKEREKKDNQISLDIIKKSIEIVLDLVIFMLLYILFSGIIEGYL